jgi:hypothetical protein
MILFIDTEKQTVFLYEEKEVIQVPFNEINILNDYTKGKTVYYINQIIETNSEDVVNLVNSIAGTAPQPVDDGQKWIHPTIDNSIVINDIQLSLRGKYDIRPLDTQMQTYISRSPVLQKLIKNGQISIIGKQQRKKLLIEKIEKDKKEREIEDKKLDDIIVKDKARDHQTISSDDDVEEIDLTEEVKGIK